MSKGWRYNMNKSTNSKDLRDKEFLNRIKKSLYYSKLPATDCLSLPVSEFTAEFFTEIKNDSTLEKFDVEEVSRISRNICISPCTLILALLYIERLKDCNPEYLQQISASELFLITLMVASKFLHDDGEDDEVITAEWAISGKLTISRINKLEKDFLDAIEWTVFVGQQDFLKRLRQLEKDVAYREVQKREWCSYTEICCLMNPVQLIAIARVVIQVAYICLVTYIAGLMMLFGATLLVESITMISLFSMLLGSELIKCLMSWRTDFTSSTFNENASSLNLLTKTRFHKINDDLLMATDSLIRNDENVMDFSAVEIGNDTHNDDDTLNWQWWLNSTMIWLPKYCGLNSDINENANQLFVTRANKFFVSTFNSTQIRQITKDYHQYYMNWKEVLDSIVSRLTQSWRRLRDLPHENLTPSSILLVY